MKKPNQLSEDFHQKMLQKTPSDLLVLECLRREIIVNLTIPMSVDRLSVAGMTEQQLYESALENWAMQVGPQLAMLQAFQLVELDPVEGDPPVRTIVISLPFLSPAVSLPPLDQENIREQMQQHMNKKSKLLL